MEERGPRQEVVRVSAESYEATWRKGFQWERWGVGSTNNGERRALSFYYTLYISINIGEPAGRFQVNEFFTISNLIYSNLRVR